MTSPVDSQSSEHLNNLAAESLAQLERRAASGDAEAAGYYRELIECGVVQWAFGLPTGDAPSSGIAPCTGGLGHGEAALHWAAQVAGSLPDGLNRFRESTKHSKFNNYAGNWTKCLWNWVKARTPDGLKRKLACGILPQPAIHFYLIQRAVFFCVTREHPQFFNAKFIRDHLRFFVLAEFLKDAEVLAELDRPRRIKPEHARHKKNQGVLASFVLLMHWLAGCLWQVAPSERAAQLSALMRDVSGDNTVPDYTTDQINAARKTLGLIPERRFGRR